MQSIKDIENLKGKKVLLRVDYNVPVVDGKVLDDFRIKASLKSIKYLVKKGAIVILLSHIDHKQTLAPVARILKKHIKNLQFIENSIFSNQIDVLLSSLKNGDVVLLENLRREDGEEKNSPSFARALSRMGEVYVNDAFSVSHRAHASIVGLPKLLPHFVGLQMLDEIKHLSLAFEAQHPFLFILGGAKFSTKLPLVKKFLKQADNVFVGGALANDFFKIQGHEVGTSLVEAGNFEIKNLFKAKNLMIPKDVEVTYGKSHAFVSVDKVKPNECIVDIGPDTFSILEDLIMKAKFIVWNGPLGKYENGFGTSTERLLKVISKSKAFSILGGGDTVAIISKLKLQDKFGFVSTGGGATIEYLSTSTLTGIKALK